MFWVTFDVSSYSSLLFYYMYLCICLSPLNKPHLGIWASLEQKWFHLCLDPRIPAHNSDRSSLFFIKYASWEAEHNFGAGLVIQRNFRLDQALRVAIEQTWSRAMLSSWIKWKHRCTFLKLFQNFVPKRCELSLWLMDTSGLSCSQDDCLNGVGKTLLKQTNLGSDNREAGHIFSSSISSEWVGKTWGTQRKLQQ